jgi:hypothetical protein
MTTEDHIRARLAQAAAEEHDEQLQSLLHQTYRQLEHAYHCSPEYGRMVERYPVLARAIARCRQPDLVGDPVAPSATAPRPRCRPVSQLHWQRSHGEL